MTRPTVAVLQHRLLHYRVPLFQRLRSLLGAADVELRLLHGQASPRERTRQDEAHLPWAEAVQNRHLHVGGVDLIWQPLLAQVRDADLVVLMQENRILSNYPLLLRRARSHQRLAWWGHGGNLQSNAPHGWRERWKAFWLTRVDWWFAYTDHTVQRVRARGFDARRITCLNNAIDGSSFRRDLAAVDPLRLAARRAQFGIGDDAPVAIHCGSLYRDKRIDLLVRAADRLRAALPDFHCLVVGDGPEASRLQDAARTRPWLHLCGARIGADKALLYRMAQVQLNPGGVGLHVLDAFAAGTPLITMAGARHGPEIVYLRDHDNGRIVPGDDDDAALADAARELLCDAALRQRLVHAGLTAARRLTVDAMAERFRDGVVACLQTDAAPARSGIKLSPPAGTLSAKEQHPPKVTHR